MNVEVIKFDTNLIGLRNIDYGYRIMIKKTDMNELWSLYRNLLDWFCEQFNEEGIVFCQKENNKIGVIVSNKKLLHLLAEKFNFTFILEHQEIESIIYSVLSKHFFCLITETLMKQIKEELVSQLNKSEIHVLNKDVSFAADCSAVYVRNKKYYISF